MAASGVPDASGAAISVASGMLKSGSAVDSPAGSANRPPPSAGVGTAEVAAVVTAPKLLAIAMPPRTPSAPVAGAAAAGDGAALPPAVGVTRPLAEPLVAGLLALRGGISIGGDTTVVAAAGVADDDECWAAATAGTTALLPLW